MASTLDLKVQEIADGMSKRGLDNAFTFDPTMISTITGLVSDLIGSLKGCGKTPAQAAETMKNPNFLERFVFRRKVRNHINDAEMYGHAADQLVQATFEVGSAMTKSDVEKLYSNS